MISRAPRIEDGRIFLNFVPEKHVVNGLEVQFATATPTCTDRAVADIQVGQEWYTLPYDREVVAVYVHYD